MKYLLDLKSCLSETKALFDKSGLEIYTLKGIWIYSQMPKGRTSPKLPNGAKLLHKSNIQVIDGSFRVGSTPDEELKRFLQKKEGKKYTIVSDEHEIIGICKKENIPYIPLSKLESIAKYDKEKYENSIESIKEEASKLQKDITIGQVLSIMISIAVFFIWYYQEAVLAFITLTLIIPSSILVSGILFKLKKTQLLYYSILEFIIGLVIAYMIYHFYQSEEMGLLFKLISLLTAVFTCVRAFTNFDTYAAENENKVSRLWNKIF
ncbi:MAG: hypothetical protein AB8G15_05120 [Saprospiraceae bacterium]